MQAETQLLTSPASTLRLIGRTTADSSLDDLFKQLFNAPSTVDQLSILTQRSEADVVKIRQKADGEEAIAWRIKMCCDVNLVKRDHAPRGRGNVDILGRGVKAAVRRRAEELSCGTATIWLNLRIYRTFFQNDFPENTILEDKGFYKAALRAPKPLAALRVFARLREKRGTTFRVNDAFRWAIKKREQQRQLKVYGRVKRSQLIPYLQKDLIKLQEMLRVFPDKRLAHRLYKPMVDALNEQLTDILETTAAESLRGLCQARPTTVFTIEDLSQQTGIAAEHVRYYMNQLENDRVVYCVNKVDKLAMSWRCPQMATVRPQELTRVI